MKRKRLHRQRGVQKFARNRILYFLLSLSTAFLFFMSGCGGGSTPFSSLQKEKSAVPEKKKTELAKASETKEIEKKEIEKKEETDYTYNPAGKPDPFKPFIQITPTKDYLKTVPLTPLQKYEISQLKLVAIIVSAEGNIALVEDSAGKGYFLKKGTGIGKNDGKVKRILKDKVIIEEVYDDISGQKKTNEISLFLHKVEEGGES